MNFLGNIKQKRGDHCCHQPSAARKLQDVKYCQTLRHIPCCFLWRGTEVFHQKSLLIDSWEAWGERRRGCSQALPRRRGGLSPLASRQGRRPNHAEGGGRKSWCSKFLGVLPTSSCLHSREASQTLKGPAERGVGLSVLTWGQLLPTVFYSPVLTRPLRPPDPSAGPSQSRTAPALKLISPFPPLLFFFFPQALSGCMEQQGPMQIPGTPPSPLIHCELPEGPPQALLHIGTPPATLCPFGAGRYASSLGAF